MSNLLIFLKNNSIELSSEEVGAVAFLITTLFNDDILSKKLILAWAENTTYVTDDNSEIQAILIAYGLIKNKATVTLDN